MVWSRPCGWMGEFRKQRNAAYHPVQRCRGTDARFGKQSKLAIDVGQARQVGWSALFVLQRSATAIYPATRFLTQAARIPEFVERLHEILGFAVSALCQGQAKQPAHGAAGVVQNLPFSGYTGARKLPARE